MNASEHLEKNKITITWEYWKQASSEMKEKVRKIYFQKNMYSSPIQTLQQKSIQRKKNTWEVPFKRYLGPFVKWRKENHRQMIKDGEKDNHVQGLTPER